MKMIPEREFNKMRQGLIKDPLTDKIKECCATGEYELNFRMNFCGLNFINQRIVQCPYLDLDGEYLDLQVENGNRTRTYHCLRLTHLLNMVILDPNGGDDAA